MASPSFKIVADPTFKAKVGIPLAGGGEEKVEFTFRHRTRSVLAEWIKGLDPKEGDAEASEEAKRVTDIDRVLEMAVGWELAEEFNAQNVGILLDNYLGASVAIFHTYLSELARNRLGN
jgi:hypothetical protein